MSLHGGTARILDAAVRERCRARAYANCINVDIYSLGGGVPVRRWHDLFNCGEYPIKRRSPRCRRRRPMRERTKESHVCFRRHPPARRPGAPHRTRAGSSAHCSTKACSRARPWPLSWCCLRSSWTGSETVPWRFRFGASSASRCSRFSMRRTMLATASAFARRCSPPCSMNRTQRPRTCIRRARMRRLILPGASRKATPNPARCRDPFGSSLRTRIAREKNAAEARVRGKHRNPSARSTRGIDANLTGNGTGPTGTSPTA